MAVKWTDDQQKAINSTDVGTVVAAAAGSGKTAVLIERTIRMLSDPELGIEADKLLAVTFTNDAANQMKQKLSAAMAEKLANEPENQWVARQQELLSLAEICTIDSFCMDLVKNNINEFELSANFTVIDGAENKLLTEKAFEEAAEFYFENRPDEMKILMDNFAEEDDREVINLGMELHNFKGSLPFPEQWKAHNPERYDKIALLQSAETSESALALAKSMKLRGEAIPEKAELVGAKEKYAPVVSAVVCAAEEIISNPDNVMEALLSENFRKAAEMRFPSRPPAKKLDERQKEIYDDITGLKDGINGCMKKLRECRFMGADELEECKKKTTEIFDVLWDFVNKAEEILWGYKVEKNKVYFSDVTDMTIKLLAKPTENGFERTELSEKIVREKRYKIILIDEFQDVNNLQDVIFKCISDTDDLNIMGKNVFVVGDIKQSIYRFRQSNPMIFDKAKKLAALEENKEKAAAILLKKNFRSRKNILDFTNFIFENTMSEKLGDVEYNKDEALDLGAEYPEENFDTEIMLLSKDFGDELSENDEDLSENRLDFECKAVALKIREMIEKKVPVTDGKVQRPCRAGDFCILLRTGKLLPQYIKAIESVNLQAVTDSVSGYLGAREVSLALSMLKVIDNPMQDIPFSAVCLSSVFGFTPDEMAEIRLIDKSKKFYQLFLAVARDESVREYGYEPVEIENKALAKKCADTIATISKLRFYASGMPLEKLVRKVYDVTDFMAVAAAFEDSQQKRANLRMLVKYASDYESSTGGGLSDFLRYLDRVSESGNDFEEALTVTASDKTVFIKTIHKSKGLEYPFVIIGDLAKEYNISKKSEKMFLNEKWGAGITVRDYLPKFNKRTLYYDFIYNADLREQLSEELRILYVAMTRAKEKLILPLYFKKNGLSRLAKAAAVLEERGKPSPDDVENLRSYSEIIGYALLLHPERQPLADFIGADVRNLPVKKTEAELTFTEKVISENQVRTDGMYIPKPIDIKLFGTIIENISREEQGGDSETLSKLTVTEFVRELGGEASGDEITYFPPLPDLSREKGGATAAQKGTDTHLFMELADFAIAEKNVSQELERLVSLNRMTEEEAGNVDVKTAEKFFESEIYQRCKKASAIFRERKFMAKLSDLTLDNPVFEEYNNKDVMVQGIADLIIEEDDGYIIVDYKTDNVREEEELIARHWIQLLLYRAAFDVILDKKVKDCYIYSFKLMRAIKVDFDNLQKVHKKA